MKKPKHTLLFSKNPAEIKEMHFLLFKILLVHAARVILGREIFPQHETKISYILSFMGFKMSPSPKCFNKPILRKSDLNDTSHSDFAHNSRLCHVSHYIQIRFSQNWLVNFFLDLESSESPKKLQSIIF